MSFFLFFVFLRRRLTRGGDAILLKSPLKSDLIPLYIINNVLMIYIRMVLKLGCCKDAYDFLVQELESAKSLNEGRKYI